MAVYLHDDLMDLLLAGLALGNKVFLCSALPINYTQASATYMLAQGDVTTGDGNGDYTIGNGGSDGRKLTVAAQGPLTVENAGTWTHVAICSSGSGGKVLGVWALPTGVALAVGNTATTTALTHTVRDPAAV